MNFIKSLLSFFTTNRGYFTGVVADDRTAEEIAQDYLHSERAVVTTGDPFGNSQITALPFPVDNQLSTSECVPHAATYALSFERFNSEGHFVPLSPTFVYRLRSNYSGEGSIPPNIFNILHNTGAPLLTTLPTPQYEIEANAVNLTTAMYNEAEIYKGGFYYSITPPNDINLLAQVAQQNHAISICIYATYDEYALQYPLVKYPNLKQGQAEIQHEVTILPMSGFLLNGKRYVAVADSAWFGGWKLRYFSEDFIKARVTQALYWTAPQTLTGGPAPKYTFSKLLQFGSTGEDVKALQQLLIAEKLLPADCVTGVFAGHTLAGVKAFQSKYASEILLPVGLLKPTGVFGLSSIAKANQLCR